MKTITATHAFPAENSSLAYLRWLAEGTDMIKSSSHVEAVRVGPRILSFLAGGFNELRSVASSLDLQVTESSIACPLSLADAVESLLARADPQAPLLFLSSSLRRTRAENPRVFLRSHSAIYGSLCWLLDIQTTLTAEVLEQRLVAMVKLTDGA